MKRGLMLAVVLMVVLGACGADLDGSRSIVAQSDDQQPVRLAPPDAVGSGESELVIQIEVGTFAEQWRAAQETAGRFGGVVTATTTGLVDEEGGRFSFGTLTIEVPSDRFDSALDLLRSLGTVVSSDFRSGAFSRTTSEIVATITESPSAVARVEPAQGRVSDALDTAGDILLTMVAVAIVAGAVLIPLGLLLLLGLAVWQKISRQRVVPTPPSVAGSEPEAERNSVDV